METKYDIIIIGGGPGGYTAALYGARGGLRTLVIEKLSPGGQMATAAWVDNYPGFDEGIGGFDLAGKIQAGAERFGAVTEYAEVRGAALALQPKRITTSNGDLEAQAVILATGASPRKLGLPGEDGLIGRGVSYCAACDGMYYKNKVVAVVGGGNTAVADALALSKLCSKVYLIHRRDALRAEKIYQDQLARVKNVEIIWNAQVKQLLHEKSLTGLLLTDRKEGRDFELRCDGVFAAIGRVPDTEIFRSELALDEQGYIIADETTRTNLPGVFAVGDVRVKPLRQIITAASDGAVASRFAQEYIASLED